jgi:hypothetical protein
VTTWYIIDTRSREIINAVETDTEIDARRVVDRMVDSEHLVVDRSPSRRLLENYRYWNERP